jgi:predicted naringenin-chalcone synthase
MGLAVLGMGTAVPPHRVSREQALEAAKVLANCDTDQAAALTALYNHTDIASRHMVFGKDVLRDVVQGTNETGSPFVPCGPASRGPDTAERMRVYQREALPLALEASQGALREGGLDPADVSHLVTVSCTGFAAPGFDIGLIKSLHLRPTVGRTHIGFMGCHGAFNALRVARAFVGTERCARVLVCAVELASIHYYYTWNPKRLVGNALFGDGAAALAAGPYRDSDHVPWRCVANGSCLFPDSEYALTWSIGNYGFDMTLSTRVPNLIAAHLRPWLETWLAEHRLTVAEVGSWAIHPGGPRILRCIEESLGLPGGSAAASRDVLHEFGNMSSPTILFILDCLRRRNAPRPCVALGFGPGMVVEGMLFR